MRYEDALKHLTSNSKFKINLGLERIKEVLKRLNHPEKYFKIIHVAGTNGKGSVCALTSEILKNSGCRTGLYTSPHLVEYTERIKINGEDISKDDFAEYFKLVCDAGVGIDLTEFEILTAVAFKYFSDKKIEIAVIETGLGGRFDATNAPENKFLSVITSVSNDHCDRLGDTIEQIAFEKAGIIKENVPVIISDKNPGFKTVKAVAESKYSKVLVPSSKIVTEFKNGINFLIVDGRKYEFSLNGDYQKDNTGLVLETVKYLNNNGFRISENALINSLKTVKWGARLEYIKEKNLLIDGAHNPDAAFELKKNLDKYFSSEKRIFIYSVLNTKDYVKIAQILFEPDDEIYFYEFNHKNAVAFEEYTKKLPELKKIKKLKIDELDDILKREELKIVTGSLYMIGELYTKLKK